jgi:hypothetical protein
MGATADVCFFVLVFEDMAGVGEVSSIAGLSERRPKDL